MNKAAFNLFAAKLDEAKARMLREVEHHAYTCPDPVACEIRAWQALFDQQTVIDSMPTSVFWKGIS